MAGQCNEDFIKIRDPVRDIVRDEAAFRVQRDRGLVPLPKTGAEIPFEVFSQCCKHGAILVTSNLPFDEWTEIFDSGRLPRALLDRLTHHVHILEMNGESYRLNRIRTRQASPGDRSSHHAVAPVGPQAASERAAGSTS